MKVIDLFLRLKFTSYIEVYTEENDMLAIGKLSDIIDFIYENVPYPAWLNSLVTLIDFNKDSGNIEIRVKGGSYV